MAASSPRSGAAPRPLPIRLRHVLLVAGLGLAAWLLVPRLRAAVTVYDLGNAFADYGLCMAGPTGPKLLREDPRAFQRLVRRRLIASDADDRPFGACAPAARQLAGDVTAAGLHELPARRFRAWGLEGDHRLAELAIDGARLKRLAARGWPFIRGSYEKLIRKSLRAPEAAHPARLPRPRLGRGLPGWRARYRAVRRVPQGFLVAIGAGANLTVHRTRDGGVTFDAVPAQRANVSDFGEQCQAGADRSFLVELSDDGRYHEVRSIGPDGAPYSTELVSAQLRVEAIACDERAVVALIGRRESRDVALRICGYRRPCVDMPLPTFAGTEQPPRLPVDVARMDGITVLATAMHGVVRTASTRNDGRSWTPFAVAFDLVEHRDARADARVPTRLLRLGEQLLLHGAPRHQGGSYPVLVSDDAGASWRPPEAPVPGPSAAL